MPTPGPRHTPGTGPPQQVETRLRNYSAVVLPGVEFPPEIQCSGVQGGGDGGPVRDPCRGVSTVRRCAASWGSRTGNLTTGPVPVCCSPRWLRRRGAGPGASTRTRTCSSSRSSSNCSTRACRCSRPAGPSECLREDLGSDLASANLVLTGSSSVLARSNGEVVDLLAGGQGVFNIVPLAGVRRSSSTRTSCGWTPQSRRRRARSVPPVSRPRGPPGSEHDGPRARRAHTPSGLCARLPYRFAHPSERLFAALLDLAGRALGLRAGRVPARVGRARHAGGGLSPGLLPSETGHLH